MTRSLASASLKLKYRLGIAVAVAALSAIGCGPSYPKCDDDNDCKKGEFCVNGMCQQCRQTSDCPAGQECAKGRCQAIEKYCTNTGDCGVDEECRANRCVAKPAEVSSDDSGMEPRSFGPGPCEVEPVYFAFDSSDLDDAARAKLSSNASCLRERKANGVHLTGLTDPRGTEEYNLALGDRRAASAEKYLKSLGVAGEVSHSSVGEEMARGTDEASWALDRRVDFEKK